MHIYEIMDGLPEKVLTHPWQEQGVGRAPFRCIGFYALPSSSMAEQNPDAYQNALRDIPKGLGVGTCHVCGTALMNNYIIQDADGKRFVVGSECVARTGDTKLITKVEQIERDRKRKAAQAKKQAAFALRREAALAELERQREANGGLTDQEIAVQRRKEEETQRQAVFVKDNAWLIDALRDRGPFSESMIQRLETGPFNEGNFSPRMLDIMQDMYAQTFGRRNSKPHTEAMVEFNRRLRPFPK